MTFYCSEIFPFLRSAPNISFAIVRIIISSRFCSALFPSHDVILDVSTFGLILESDIVAEVRFQAKY